MKVVLCAILRTENRYIEEWLDYHLSLGFDHVYLCDNAQGHEERVSEIVCNNAKYDKKVSIFPYFDKHSQQVRAYTDCYKERGLAFDWMAFVDIDEFITFSSTSKYKSIQDYLNDIGREADTVLLNWRTFGDCGLIKDDGGKVLERFKYPLPDKFTPFNMFGKKPYNCHVKQIIKSNLPIYQILPHATPTCDGYHLSVVDGDGSKIELKDVQPKFTFDTCYVRHFYTRTIEEYIATKIKRGVGVVNKELTYDLSAFFLYNKPTLSKYLVYKRALKTYKNHIDPSFFWWMKQCLKMWIIVPIMGVMDFLMENHNC